MSGEKKVTEQSKAEHKPSRGFHWFAYVVLPVIVALISIFGTYWLTQYGNRIRTLRYIVTSSAGIFQKPDVQGGSIKILFGDKPIENLSTVNVQIFNTSDQDFDDVPLAIMLKGKNGKPVVLHTKCETPSSTEPQTQPSDPSFVNFPYRLRVANRGDKAVLTAEYLIEGRDAPDVYVTITKKGLEAERGTPTDQSFNKYAYVAVGVPIGVFFALAFRLFIAIRRVTRGGLPGEWEMELLQAMAEERELERARKAREKPAQPDR